MKRKLPNKDKNNKELNEEINFKPLKSMKKNYRFYTTLFLCGLYLLTSLISIGYGALNQNLNIAGELDYEKMQVKASNLSYDNSTSGLPATTAQEALDVLQVLGKNITFSITIKKLNGNIISRTYNCVGGTTWKEFIEDSSFNINGYFLNQDYNNEVTYNENPENNYTTRSYVWYNDNFQTSEWGRIAYVNQPILEKNYYATEGAYCCFDPNTLITIDLEGNTKRIKDFEVGDKLVVINRKTGKKEITTVLKDASEHPETYDMTILTLENNIQLKFNSYHPILTTEGYKSITKYNNYEKLNIGDIAITENGKKLKITNIKRYISKRPELTYNLLIKGINEDFLEEDYSYIANGVLVHTGIAKYDDEDEWRNNRRHLCKYTELYKKFDFNKSSDKEIIKFLINLYKKNKKAEKEYIDYYITADQYFRYTEFAIEVKNNIKKYDNSIYLRKNHKGSMVK